MSVGIYRIKYEYAFAGRDEANWLLHYAESSTLSEDIVTIHKSDIAKYIRRARATERAWRSRSTRRPVNFGLTKTDFVSGLQDHKRVTKFMAEALPKLFDLEDDSTSCIDLWIGW